jgi:outer membrane protein OmpA-like peptidoglycan-associated protein
MKIIASLRWLAFAAICFNLNSAPAEDLAGSKDNPYIKRFDGSSIVRYKADNYETYNFYDKDFKTAPVSFEGKSVRVAYVVPKGGASSLEVYRNYEEELKAKGFTISNSVSIGGDNVQDISAQRGLEGINWATSQNDYYIYGVKSDPTGTVHIAVTVAEMKADNSFFKTGDIAIYVDSIQEKAVTNKMVDGTASDMSKQIASTGSVNLYGIYFDTAKTDIKPESKPTLDEVGKLLASDTTLKLKVVGHTDNVGTAEYNNDLSMRRAQSVVQALVSTYSVAAERLTPFGAGFTQPIASNDNEDGRAKNRRVELVKL